MTPHSRIARTHSFAAHEKGDYRRHIIYTNHLRNRFHTLSYSNDITTVMTVHHVMFKMLDKPPVLLLTNCTDTSEDISNDIQCSDRIYINLHSFYDC